MPDAATGPVTAGLGTAAIADDTERMTSAQMIATFLIGHGVKTTPGNRVKENSSTRFTIEDFDGKPPACAGAQPALDLVLVSLLPITGRQCALVLHRFQSGHPLFKRLDSFLQVLL